MWEKWHFGSKNRSFPLQSGFNAQFPPYRAVFWIQNTKVSPYRAVSRSKIPNFPLRERFLDPKYQSFPLQSGFSIQNTKVSTYRAVSRSKIPNFPLTERFLDPKTEVFLIYWPVKMVKACGMWVRKINIAYLNLQYYYVIPSQTHLTRVAKLFFWKNALKLYKICFSATKNALFLNS